MPENNQNQEDLKKNDLPPEATTYGGVLRIAREGKELTVDQVASQLRISPGQIEGLEADNYKVFPTPVYARAHLRSYSRLLGLDDEKVIEMFNNSLKPEDRDPRTFIKKTTSGLAPYQDAQPKNYVGKFVAGLLFLAVLIVVGYFGYSYVNNPENNIPLLNKQTAAVEPAQEKVPAQSEAPAAAQEKAASETQTETAATEPAAPAAQQPSTQPAAEDEAAAKAQREQELKERLQKEAEEKAKQQAEAEKQAAEAKAKAEELKKAQEAAELKTPAVLVRNPAGHWDLPISAKASDPVAVKLETVKGECWFGIYRDNKLTYNVQLKAGQSREYSVEMPFKVSVGNRQSAAVRVNGRPVELDTKTNSTSTVFTVVSE